MHVLVDTILDYYETNKHLTVKGTVIQNDGKSTGINKEVKISNELLISANHFYHPMEDYRESFIRNLYKQYIKKLI
jgi:hypothetical protein